MNFFKLNHSTYNSITYYGVFAISTSADLWVLNITNSRCRIVCFHLCVRNHIASHLIPISSVGNHRQSWLYLNVKQSQCKWLVGYRYQVFSLIASRPKIQHYLFAGSASLCKAASHHRSAVRCPREKADVTFTLWPPYHKAYYPLPSRGPSPLSSVLFRRPFSPCASSHCLSISQLTCLSFGYSNSSYINTSQHLVRSVVAQLSILTLI